MTTKAKAPAKKPGAIVTYRLPDGKQEVPALIVTVDKGKFCLTVFALTGPYVAHGVSQGSKAGCWH